MRHGFKRGPAALDVSLKAVGGGKKGRTLACLCFLRWFTLHRFYRLPLNLVFSFLRACDFLEGFFPLFFLEYWLFLLLLLQMFLIL